jgi:hypothetical protein
MIAYEFYQRDKVGEPHLLGILPERRKNRKRISGESVVNWVIKIVGNNGNFKNIYFVKVDV